MSKKKFAIIWRKSVYDTHRCPQCGTRLIDKRNQPANVIKEEMVLAAEKKEYFLCQNCNLPVAFVEPYNGPLKPGIKGGRWEGGA